MGSGISPVSDPCCGVHSLIVPVFIKSDRSHCAGRRTLKPLTDPHSLADTQHSDSSFPFTPSTTIDSGWWMGSVVVSPQAALRGDSVMLNDDGRGGDSDHIDTAPTKRDIAEKLT
ncbi:hypothetical protein BLNAU_20339 [Blattamonas nauphoetae]|uniref:Uncharacterized protein n=1 Tax=Blattamonas nauphoetae TaxID=2049346 RepID=A0ABQ9WZ15_9EUKA|nr:hypothetical protein BLNAU_20339 [Blattamonas nauphoetae]